MYKNIFKYDVDNIKDLFFKIDFFSFCYPFSFMHSVELFYLFALLSVLGAIIIFMARPYKILKSQRRLALQNWKPITIPDDTKNDILYIKLGYQCVKNTLNVKSKSIYSSWGMTSIMTLTEQEITRIHIAALRAEAAGELHIHGYAFDRISDYIHFKNKLMHTRNGTQLLRSEPRFIFLIRKYDIYRVF